jgi:MFS family permease
MSTRRSTTTAFFGGVAVANTGFIAAITVTGLVAEQITGSARLSGLPGAIGTFGTALGATVISMLIGRAGSRTGLSIGYVTAAAGAAIAMTATVLASFPMLLAGLLILGVGHSATQLSRYAAADLYDTDHRARVVGLIVWAGTIGSVVGPSLLEPSGRLAVVVRLPELSGAYGVSGAFFTAAAILYGAFLRKSTSRPTIGTATTPGIEPGHRRDLLRLPQVQVALSAMIVGQLVMVLIMAMTPLHIRQIGLGLGTVGFVISAHTLGMFALSPVTGWLTDRFGQVQIIVAGVVLLTGSAVLAATAPPDGRTQLAIALFVLGLGWNFGFVAGSSLLTLGVPEVARTALQGQADSLVWMAAALASLASGFVLEAAGYATLSVAGGLMALLTLIVVARRRLQPALMQPEA